MLLTLLTVLAASPTPAWAVPPGDPTAVTAVPGRRAITVSWTAPVGGVAVNHYVATTTPDGRTCSTTTTSCTITTLTANTSYVVTVAACATSDSSDCSTGAAASAVVPGPPPTPARPTVAYNGSNSGEAVVSWTAYPAGNNVGLFAYRITPTPSAGLSGPCLSDVAPNLTSCVVQGLTAGTSYTFQLTAVGALNTGSSSTSSASLPIVGGPPGKPATPTVEVVSDTSVTLSWAGPTDGIPVLSYVVTSSSPVTGLAGCTDKDDRSCTLTGLTASAPYTFQVQAIGGGNSPLSDPSTAVIAGKPGVPGTPFVEVIGANTALVTWDAPDGGGTVDSYTVTPSTAGPVSAGCGSNPSTRSCTFTGLDPNTSYTFTVRAVGAGGVYTDAAASSNAVNAGPPGAPGNPTATITGNGAVTVTWTAPTTGGLVDGYTLTPSPGATVPVGCGDDLVNLSCNFTGLNPGTAYTFRVAAVSAVGSTDSAGSSNSVTPGPPGTPGTPTVVVTGSGTATVSWTASSGGGPLTRYTVIPSPNEGSVSANCGDNTAIRTCTVTGLTPATTYTFVVRAEGPGGNAPSAASTGVQPDAPAVPGTPTAAVTGVGQVTLTWTAPVGGGPVTRYTITSDPAATISPSCGTDLNDLSCVITGLTPGTSYTFLVTANGQTGNTPSAASSNAVRPGPPAVPGTPTVVVTGSGAVTVSWTLSTGGGPVTGYTVTATPNEGTPVGCGGGDPARVSCTFTGLTPGTLYTFLVTANGPAGNTPSAASSTAVRPDAPAVPGTPTVVVTGSGTATVSWTAPVGGGPVVSYTVTPTGGAGSSANCGVDPTVLSCDFTGLDPTASYTFAVTANNAVANTASAGSSTAVVPGAPAVPGTPTVSLTTPGQLTVTWAASVGGGAVTRYTVTPSPAGGTSANCGDNPAVLSCVFTGLNQTLAYAFSVRAEGPGGNTNSAGSSTAIVPAAPGVPGTPTVANGAPGTVVVTWTAPTSGGPVATYTVNSEPTVTPPGSCVNTASLTCTFTGLDTGETYTFGVTATGPAGDTPSAARSLEITPGAPNAPGTPTVAVTAPNTVRVTWAASPAGGGAVIGYTVTSDPRVTPPAACVRTVALTCDFTGLNPATSYTFLVTANGSSGNTPAVARSAAITPAPAGVPGTPTVRVTAPNTVRVSWTAPTGGGPVTSYSVTSDPAVNSPACTTVTALTCDFAGLDPAVTYTFLVTANGPAGNNPSAAVSAPIRASGPTAPSAPSVALAGPNAVRVTWTAPAGGPVSTYTVTSSPAVNAPSSCVDVVAVSCTFTGLDSGTPYTFTVTATGPVGTPATSPSSAEIIPGPPDVPERPMATLTGVAGQVRVSWVTPDPGAGIAGFTVQSNPGRFGCATPAGPTDTTCVVTGLVTGTSYTFRVQAVGVTNSGNSGFSRPSAAVTPGAVGPPATPDKPVAVPVERGRVSVSWTVPGGGGPVTNYTVESDPAPAGAATGCAASVSVTPCVFTGLDPTVAYRFRVTAHGPLGDPVSPWSDLVKPGAPAVPYRPVAVVTGPGQVSVTWTMPAGGGAVTNYAVESDPALSGMAAGCAASASVTPCVFTGLDPTVAYRFRVTARGPLGEPVSEWSEPVKPGAPGVPGTATVRVTALGTVRVGWTAPTNGGPVTSYSVTSDPAIGSPACTTVTALTCDFAGLNPAGSYTFLVTANGPAGPTPAAAASASVQAAGPGVPAAPGVALAGPYAVRVTWTAPAGGPATSYTVTSSPAVNAPPTCVDVAALSCTFTGLDSGVPYTFTVTATGPVGTPTQSPASVPIVAGPPETPARPTVALTGVNGEVRVSWTASDPGAGIAGFTVQSNPGRVGCAVAAGASDRSCVVAGLTPGTAYTFRVQAVGVTNSGNSGFSQLSDPVTPGAVGVPATPNKPVAVPVERGRVSVSWTVPAGGGPVTNYTVEADPALSGAASGCAASVTVTPCVFTGLDPTVAYRFRVTAHGPLGNPVSPWSDLVKAGAPAVPYRPVAEVTGPGQVSVSWTMPAEGGPVTNYTVDSDPLLPEGATRCAASVSVTPCVFTGLDAAVTYRFRVTAHGPLGDPVSDWSDPVRPGAPGAPGTPTTQVTALGTVRVSWTAATGGGPLTGYSVTSSPSVGPPSECTAVTATTCDFTGLNAAVSYTFLVTAIGPAGSTPSAETSAAIRAAGPGVPAAPSVVLAGANAVRVSWTAPVGGPVTGYTVTSSPVVNGPTVCTDVRALTCTVVGLESGTPYTFTVTATGPVGTPTTSPASAEIVPGPPDAPARPTVVATGVIGQVRVSWEAPSVGAGIAGYTVQSTPGRLGCTVAANVNECLVNGLDPATGYTFRVRALGVPNSGDSPFGAQSATVVPGALAAPTDVDVAGANRQIAVSWTPPANAGQRVAYYVATANPGGATCRTVDATTTECTIVGLTNLTSYTVTVVAVGVAGTANSAASAPSTRVRPSAGAPGTPTGVQASSRNQSVLVSWTAPVSTGDGISNYVATAAGTPDGRTCTTPDAATLSCLITGLTNGSEYRVTVVAVGRAASGTSASSTPPVVVVPSNAPGAPTGVTATPGTSDLTVAFTPGTTGDGVVNFTATATGGPSSGPCTTPNATTLTCVITGLTPGLTYAVTVVANGITPGSRSPASTPSSPALVTAWPAPTLPTTVPTGTDISGSLTSSAGTTLPYNTVTTIAGNGYAAYTGLTVGVYPGTSGSAPTRLATVVTDSLGAFTATVSIAGGPTGTRTIIAAGMRSTGTVRYKSVAVTVTGTLSFGGATMTALSPRVASIVGDVRRRVGSAAIR